MRAASPLLASDTMLWSTSFLNAASPFGNMMAMGSVLSTWSSSLYRAGSLLFDEMSVAKICPSAHRPICHVRVSAAVLQEQKAFAVLLSNRLHVEHKQLSTGGS